MKLSDHRINEASQTGRKVAEHFFNSLSSIIAFWGILLFLLISACDNNDLPEHGGEADRKPEETPVESEEGEELFDLDDLLLVRNLEGYLLPLSMDNELWLINTRGEIINSRPLDLDSAMYELFFEHGAEPTLVDQTNPLVMKLNEQGQLQAVLYDYEGNLLTWPLDPWLNHYYNDYGHLVYENGRYGFTDYKGEILLESSYDMLEIIGGSRFIILNSGSEKGLFDCANEEIVFSGYEKVDYYGWMDEGLILAGGEDIWIVYTLEGDPVAELNYDQVREPSEGLIPVMEGDLWGFVNLEGVVVVEPSYQDVIAFYNGFSPVRKGDLWGLIDAEGNIVAPADYAQLYLLYDENPPGLVARFFKRNVEGSAWNYLTETGEPFFDKGYSHIYHNKDGFIVDINDMYGFLALDGRPVDGLPLFDHYIPPEIPGTCNPDAMNIAPGYAMLNSDGLWAVHHDNKLLTGFVFEEVMDWGQPMIFDGIVQMIAREKGRTSCGLYNLDRGSYIIPPDTFDEIHYLKSDRARVLKEGLYGFVDGSGELVIDTRYDYATAYENQVAAVIEDGLLSFIDREGNRLVEPVEIELEANFWLFVQYIEGPDLYRSVNSSYFNLEGWIWKPR